MAENQPNSDERQFAVQRIYTKDLSFESPNAPEIFRGEWKPQNDPIYSGPGLTVMILNILPDGVDPL